MVQFLAGLVILLIGLAIGFIAGVIVSNTNEEE
jgi:hypothetical protein